MTNIRVITGDNNNLVIKHGFLSRFVIVKPPKDPIMYEDTKEDLEAFALAFLVISISVAIVARFLFQNYVNFFQH